MITNDLMIVTMGIAFYLIPLLLLGATLIFLWRSRATPRHRSDDSDFVRGVVRDPLVVAAVLFVGGFVMVSFLTGRLSLDDYVSVPIGALDVMWRSVSIWEDPLSSESIALRGGVLIAIASVVIVVLTLVSYFRARLGRLEGRSEGGAHPSH